MISSDFVKTASEKYPSLSAAIEKLASLRFRSIPGVKNVKLVTGDKAQAFLRRAVLWQTPVRMLQKTFDFLAPKIDPRLPKYKEVLNKRLSEADIGGTIAPSARGTRSYIDPQATARVSERKGDAFSLRNVVNHEAFHANAPLGLGQSEILAHAYGGLKSRKGKLSPDVALESLGILAKARPGRMATELGLLGGAGVAAYQGVNAAYDAVKGE